MSFNLSLLPADEKNRIELDKQASFLVWQLKEAKCGPEAIIKQAEKLTDPSEKATFEQSIEKYKRVMGVA
ncbi:DUF3283 family protein [Vibrio sp. IRLE0018]|uniref:DUF3283 family protein n=1 Tax=Vibrio TaxID=662 RepID=UPI001592FB50|nr:MULTISPECIES: DUF3283 family protein [Vibrio]MCF8777245.1 DUF3283 family protein [Vibrio floridensis]NVC62592.1 DUF3283 family protein [Vibrio sp. 05-20-BW147]HAS6346412.1 DUF3283 family protein [Vibrio vulnificus]